MAFEALASFIRPGFDLPFGGKTYYVPAPPARHGVWLQSIVDAGHQLLVMQSVSTANKQILSDDQERTAYQMALGSAYDQMLADDVPWPVLKHAGMTALIYWTRDASAAEAYWARYEASQGEAPTQPPEQPAAGSPTDQ